MLNNNQHEVFLVAQDKRCHEKKELLMKKPHIFSKKVSANHKILGQNTTVNTLGQTRHFPPATKEWFNSIYAYSNNNTVKNLPVASKTLIRLIKSYFNLAYKKIRVVKNKRFNNKRISTRLTRLSLNKILVGKALLKHTSSKVTITLYVYNEEKRLLSRKLRALSTRIFPSFSIIRRIRKDKPISFDQRLSILTMRKLWLSRKLKLNNLLVQSTLDNLNITLFKDLLSKNLDKELVQFSETKMKLALNKAKFEKGFLARLSPLISRLFQKKVEFNIVNLKNLHLNSDIFTQAIASKLKNRDNKLLRVLKIALSLVKIPRVNRVREKYGKDDRARIWINKVKNLTLLPCNAGVLVNSARKPEYARVSPAVLPANPANMVKLRRDLLSEILLHISPTGLDLHGRETCETCEAQKKVETMESQKSASNILDLALDTVKYKTMAGVRLEAKGRLTRRFTAARSVFKVKWKGGLRNIESSYRGQSVVTLRGHAKPNVQYSFTKSKNRIGAFGLKGWISGK